MPIILSKVMILRVDANHSGSEVSDYLLSACVEVTLQKLYSTITMRIILDLTLGLENKLPNLLSDTLH